MQKSKLNINSGVMKQCIIGIIISWLIVILFSLPFAIFISNEYLEVNAITYISVLIIFLSSLLGVFISSKLGREERIVVPILSLVIYLITLMCVSMLFFDGISSKLLVGSISCIIGGGTGILLGIKNKNKSRKIKRHKRHR